MFDAVSEELRAEWEVWRIVKEGIATLTEIDSWSYDDVLKANAILDFENAVSDRLETEN